MEIIQNKFVYSDGTLYHIKNHKVAGTTTRAGYRQLSIGGKFYYAHRVIWEHFNGQIPEGFVIDHINGVKDDNRIENLRVCTQQQNTWNKKKFSGDLGVQNVRKVIKTGKYQVILGVDGKTKCFGTYDDLELAELVAQEARNKYYGEYA